MKRSVLFITNAYPDFDTSYRGIFIQKMARLLKKEGYEITVVTPKIYQKSLYFENQNGIKVYRFPFFARNKLLIEHEKVPFIRMTLYYVTGFLTAIYAALKNRIKVVHVHWVIPTGLIGSWVGFALGKPLVVTIHGSDLRMALEKSGFIKKIFIHVCRRAANLNCVSHEQEKEMESLGLGGNKISIIPMGIDEVFLERGKSRGNAEKRGPFSILSNRNLLPIYNLSLLIRAVPIVLKENPEAKFLIAGEGAEKTSLEEEARKLNINSSLQFLGRVPHQGMPDLLARTDIYVSTSLHDGASVSLLEAMGAGAFPIVSDIPANREWIHDGENGFLFPVNDEKILARKILDAARDKELLMRGRKSNQSIVKEKAFWPVCIEKIKGIYEDQMVRK